MYIMKALIKGISLVSILAVLAYTSSLLSGPTAEPIDVVEHNCLAMNIYHEARNEPEEGQIAVAHVTLNRVNHTNWPNTICDVVYDPMQFSWTHLVLDHTPRESASWETSKTIARDVMLGNNIDPTHGAVFYHANYVNPTWVTYVTLSRVIGSHLFYTWDGDWDATN
jgi:spore germination cell wall hydrolase CwlJ-like protein